MAGLGQRRTRQRWGPTMRNSLLAVRQRLPALMLSVLLATPVAVNGVSADSTSADVGRQQVPPSLGPVLLQLGGDIYANLRRARSAVLNREKTLLIVAVDEMRDDLDRLRLPPQELALATQPPLPNRELPPDSGKAFDEGQWLPLRFEIDEIEESGSEQSSGGSVASEGTISVANGSIGMFPLRTLRKQLDVAWKAAHQTPTDWQTVLSAVRSALASIYWSEPSPGSAAAGVKEN